MTDSDFGTHTLNIDYKRLEPKSTLCDFCKNNQSQSMADNYFVPVYREQTRTNIVVYRSVKFNELKIGMPRCPDCKAIHEKADTKAVLITIGITLATIYIVFNLSLLFGFLSLFFSFGIYLVVKPLIEKKIIKNNDILTQRECAENNITVAEFILNGWSLTRPTA